MKLNLSTSYQHVLDTNSILVSSDCDLASVSRLFAPNSFSLIETQQPLTDKTNFLDRELWKQLFSILKENGEINLLLAGDGLTHDQSEQVLSFMKLSGFTNAHVKDQTI
jgi:hypothetical protein